MATASRLSDNEVIKEGFLMKESSFWKKNRQRWMVLTKDQLLSFKQKVDYKSHRQQQRDKQLIHPTETFKLFEFNKINTTTGGQEYQFEIVSKDSIRRFTAKSYYEMEDWMAKIKSVQQFVQHKNTESEPRIVNDPEYFDKL